MMELKRLKKLEADRLRVQIPERHQRKHRGAPLAGPTLGAAPTLHRRSTGHSVRTTDIRIYVCTRVVST
jgi:hypothetical protein